MTAATKQVDTGYTTSEDFTHTPKSAQWTRISTAGLPAKDQLLGSIINLAQAHFIHGEQDFSDTVAQTISLLFSMHSTKMRLHHLVAIPTALQTNTQSLSLHIIQAVWPHGASDLHNKTVDLLNQTVIGKQPPYSDTDSKLATLLKRPDTQPIFSLLNNLLSQTSSPLVREPLEVLLYLNWQEAFHAFVPSGFSVQQNSSWGWTEDWVQDTSSLVHATSNEELLRDQSYLQRASLSIDIHPVFLYKKNTI